MSHGRRLALLGFVQLAIFLLGLLLFRDILLPFLVGMAAAYLLDPVADRLTVIVVVLAFWLGGLLPGVVFLLILLPDIVLSLVALIVFGGASFPVTWVGKIRTALIFVGLLMLLVGRAVIAQWRDADDQLDEMRGEVLSGWSVDPARCIVAAEGAEIEV